MTYDTSTKEGRDKRMDELVTHYKNTGNTQALVRLIGGSVEDFDEKYEPSYGGSHPDERREA